MFLRGGVDAPMHTMTMILMDHSIMLNKLFHYGICGLANKWFESYLANHKQFASINGFASNTSSITENVPQGSVLGSLLFLLYINDLHVAIINKSLILIINKSLKKIKQTLKY